MIVPSVDIIDGKAVQLIGGKEKVLEVEDAYAVAEGFSIVNEVAVIDLDAALGRGSNSELVRRIARNFRCRVGGGIRSVESAVEMLDAGAERVILGTKAVPEILSQLPKARLIAAVDALDGEVVVDGWRSGTGTGILSKIQELRDYVSGFLVTFVENEGRLKGTKLELVQELVECAGPARVTIAGGITTASELAELERLGADGQVGMSLYTGKLGLGEALVASLAPSTDQGLWPTVVCNESGIALGLCWSSAESLSTAIERKRGVYHSRTRGLWEKGASSGNVQELLRIDLDCDRDALRFTVRQQGSGFCHNQTASCWGDLRGLNGLERRIELRKTDGLTGSYSQRLLAEPELLNAKLIEEANELVAADLRSDVVHEAADVLYFTAVKLAQSGVSLAEVESELNLRTLKLSRRGGESKVVATDPR